MRRVLRLAPALLFMLLAYGLYCSVFLTGWDRKAALGSAVATVLYVSNWCRAFKLLPMASLSPTWSLSVEEQFYLLWPVCLFFLLRIARSRRRAFLALAALVGLLVAYRAALTYCGAAPERIYFGSDARADSLLIGCCTAFVYNAGIVRLGNRGALALGMTAVVCLAALVGFFFVGPGHYDPAMFYGGYTLIAACSALVIFGLASELPGCRRLSSLLRLPAMVWVGRISYGLYLWHYFIIKTCQDELTGLPAWGAVLIGVLLTFLVSAASFYGVEKPFLRYKGRFAWRASSPSPSPAAGKAGASQAQEEERRQVVVFGE